MVKQYINIEVVKQLMRDKEIDIKEMAFLMKVTPYTVRRLLNGADQSHLSIPVIFNIARALDVSMSAFMNKTNS